jgi:hypothetical protein
MSTDSPANQALNVATAALADGATNAAWGNANTTEQIAGAFNDAQNVQNMDAARFTGQTSSEPARADSPGGADPTHNPDPPAAKPAPEPAVEPADEPASDDTSSADARGGGDD